MSIGRRFIDLARAELNSLLEKAARVGEDEGDGGHDPDHDLYHKYSLDQLTDAELEAEIERRRKAREAAARAAKAGAAPRPSPGPKPPPPRPPARPTPVDEIRQSYAALEVPPGSDFATVRKSYRALMRKYHPDRHTQSPDKQKAANEVAQKLTIAYKKLEKHLRK